MEIGIVKYVLYVDMVEINIAKHVLWRWRLVLYIMCCIVEMVLETSISKYVLYVDMVVINIASMCCMWRWYGGGE